MEEDDETHDTVLLRLFKTNDVGMIAPVVETTGFIT